MDICNSGQKDSLEGRARRTFIVTYLKATTTRDDIYSFLNIVKNEFNDSKVEHLPLTGSFVITFHNLERIESRKSLLQSLSHSYGMNFDEDHLITMPEFEIHEGISPPHDDVIIGDYLNEESSLNSENLLGQYLEDIGNGKWTGVMPEVEPKSIEDYDNESPQTATDHIFKAPSKTELDNDYNGDKHIHYHFHNHNGKPCNCHLWK